MADEGGLHIVTSSVAFVGDMSIAETAGGVTSGASCGGGFSAAAREDVAADLDVSEDPVGPTVRTDFWLSLALMGLAGAFDLACGTPIVRSSCWFVCQLFVSVLCFCSRGWLGELWQFILLLLLRCALSLSSCVLLGLGTVCLDHTCVFCIFASFGFAFCHGGSWDWRRVCGLSVVMEGGCCPGNGGQKIAPLSLDLLDFTMGFQKC